MAFNKEEVEQLGNLFDQQRADIMSDVKILLDQELRPIKVSLKTVKEDLEYVKGDFTNIKKDIGIVQDDLKIVKEDLNYVKDDLETVKESLRYVKKDLSYTKDRVDQLFIMESEDIRAAYNDITKLKTKK